MAKRPTTPKRKSRGTSAKKGWRRYLHWPHGFKEWALAVLIALNTLLAIATFVTGIAGALRPDEHPAIAVAGMAFPAFVIAEAATVVAWLIARKWVIAALMALPLVVTWGNVRTHFPLNLIGGFTTAAEDSTRFTVMTYNTRCMLDLDEELKGHSPNRMVEEILRIDADIVCLQECYGVDAAGWCGIAKEQAKAVRERYPYIIRSADEMQFLSKYPILHADDLSAGQPSAGYDGYYAKSYFVNVKGQKINLISIHLQSFHLEAEDKDLYQRLTSRELDDQLEEKPRYTLSYLRHILYPRLAKALRIRAQQADDIAAVASRANGNVILCGDFNDTPYSYSYRTIKGSMTDAFANSGIGYGNTYHQHHLLFRIDHIFYKGTIEAVDAYIPKSYCSDHYPVVATFVNRKTK